MQLLAYLEIDCFALAILLLIFLNIRSGAARYLTEQKIFIMLMAADALIIILDMMMWILDGEPGLPARNLYYAVTVFYYALNPVICMLWYFYVDYHVYRSRQHLKKMMLPMLVPACINMVLSFASIFNDNLMFYLDGDNVYHRGALFPVMAWISFAYLIYPMALIVIKQKNIPKQEYGPLLMFVIPPLIGGVIQSFIYGISLIWVCVTVSILIIFINIQNNQLYTDHLTGLYNRRQLDNYLQQVAEILKRTFRYRDDFIARYGGDEFIVLITDETKTRLSDQIERLKERVKQFNEQRIFPFEISLSIGYDYYPGMEEADVKEFLKHIDELMYLDKQKYK